MEVMLLELLLWGCLLLFFWAMKDGLGKVESDIESIGLLSASRRAPGQRRDLRFSCPQNLAEPIGSYLGERIYRYAVIEGRTYQFDRVCPPGCDNALNDGERCVAPGLVYLECRGPALLSPGA